MAKIASFGSYVPLFRLSREEMGNAWGVIAAALDMRTHIDSAGAR